MAREEYYAHTIEGCKDKKKWQKLKSHLTNTADKASNFAEPIGLAKTAYIAGLMHDLGKYSDEFQDRIEPGYKGPKVDHATAGAKEMQPLVQYCDTDGMDKLGLLSLKMLSDIGEYVVAGHHTGLPDYGEFEEGGLSRRLLAEVSDYSACCEIALHEKIDVVGASSEIREIISDIDFPSNPKLGLETLNFRMFLATKIVYSSLVDADFLDTEEFMNPEKFKSRNIKCESMRQLLRKFNVCMKKKQDESEKLRINRIRSSILRQCNKKSQLPKGLFTLTVPTGGGKTLSSLSFALRHAVKNNMDKIIYVIPYTSIIEQTAGIFKRILGENNVLEHHSNYQPPKKQDEDMKIAIRLAQESWDLPVTVTTNVQFFESIFSNRSSKLRKLHNIAGSVIILDEAQMFPLHFTKPILHVLNELVDAFGCTVVLCTATQPSFNRVLPSTSRAVEIMDDPQKVYDSLKRVEVVNVGFLSDEKLIEAFGKNDQLLCIVNKKAHTEKLYRELKKKRMSGVYHLSTNMCAMHRRKTLKTIRKRLDPKNPKPCRVVSTQLIEAGVDVDFPLVYRASAGIDSIAQSAGRCNREGRVKLGKVYYFIEEKPMDRFRTFRDATSIVLKENSDALSLQAVKAYFDRLYMHNEDNLDTRKISDMIRGAYTPENQSHIDMPHKTISELFKLIDNDTTTIIVPYDKTAAAAIEELRKEPSRATERKLQPYTVQVYNKQFNALDVYGALELLHGSYYILKDLGVYDKHTGLTTPDMRELIF